MENARFQKIPVHELRKGMFVAELDKPWLDSPFLIQGFTVSDESEIDLLVRECAHVIIDTGRMVKAEYEETKKLGRDLEKAKVKSRESSLAAADNKKRSEKAKINQSFKGTNLKPYSNSSSFEQEFSSAQNVYQEYENTVAKLYGDTQESRGINLKSAKAAVSGIVESVIRNPDACIFLTQLKRKGNYLYDRALGTSIWATALARQIGLPKDRIEVITLAAMLCDLGKTKISDRILLKKSALTDEEFNFIKDHVHVDDVDDENIETLDFEVKEIIRNHHERHDGSGYPNGLAGEEIPVFARIVGLADAYDAMINHRSYAEALSPYDAMRELYELRDIKFQAEMVEEFIQALGMYPVGTLVELNDGRVAVVVSENKANRLRPKLLVLMQKDKALLERPHYITLAKEEHAGVEIKKSLEVGAHGLDPDDFFL